jgi:hypothetical protein
VTTFSIGLHLTLFVLQHCGNNSEMLQLLLPAEELHHYNMVRTRKLKEQKVFCIAGLLNYLHLIDLITLATSRDCWLLHFQYFGITFCNFDGIGVVL